MNDLAEKALAGVDVAISYVRRRPMRFFGLAGFVVSAVAMAAGAAASAAAPSRPLTTWLGLQSPHARPNTLAGIVALVAVLVLLVLWLAVLGFVRASGQPLARVWAAAAAWSAPFAIGPPLMGTSVYSYAVFGLLQRSGQDPYRTPPAGLADVPVVESVSPIARGIPSSAGPVGTLLQHLAVSISGGSALGAVIVMRVVAVLAVIAMGRLTVELAERRRNQALTLVVLNPLILLYCVSAARLTSVLLALLLAALVLAQQRRWPLAVALACFAGSVSGQGYVALPVIVIANVLRRNGMRVWRVLTQDLVVAAAIIVGLGFAVPDGFGWIRDVGQQFSVHTPFSIAGATSVVLSPIVPGASYDDFAIGGRVAVVVAMVCTLGYLLATARLRHAVLTVAYTQLAIGLLAPVLYPWYLLWGLVLLVPRASNVQRVVVVAFSAAGCVLMPPGFSDLTSNVMTAVLLLMIAGLTAGAGYLARIGDEQASSERSSHASGGDSASYREDGSIGGTAPVARC